MKQKIIVSSITLLASLGCYYIALNKGRDAVPFVMIGGFIGALIGESISKASRDKDDDNDGPGGLNGGVSY